MNELDEHKSFCQTLSSIRTESCLLATVTPLWPSQEGATRDRIAPGTPAAWSYQADGLSLDGEGSAKRVESDILELTLWQSL